MFLYRAELKGTGKLQYVIEPCRAAGSMCELTDSRFNRQGNNNSVFHSFYIQNMNIITVSFLKIHYIYNHHVEKYRTDTFHFGVIHQIIIR